MLIKKRLNKIENYHKTRIIIFVIVLRDPLLMSIFAQDLLPRPEFQTDYQIPEQEIPSPRSSFYKYLDVAGGVSRRV
jgi:hypothetical protein